MSRMSRLTRGDLGGKFSILLGRQETFAVGDLVRSEEVLKMREGEDTESLFVVDVTRRAVLEIVELGKSSAISRCKCVTYSGEKGWVSIRTATGEALLTKRGIDVLPVLPSSMDMFLRPVDHIVTTPMDVNTSEAMDGVTICQLMPGMTCKVLVFGSSKCRGKVDSNGVVGWANLVTMDGVCSLKPPSELCSRTVTTMSSGSAASNASFKSTVKDFLQAAKDSNVECMKRAMQSNVKFASLRSKGLNPNCIDRNNEGMSALMYAASNGSVEVTEFLLHCEDIDANAVDELHRCALHHLVRMPKDDSEPQRLTICRMLLEHRATVDLRDDSDSTPIMLADMNGQRAVFDCLQASGANAAAMDALAKPAPAHGLDGRGELPLQEELPAREAPPATASQQQSDASATTGEPRSDASASKSAGPDGEEVALRLQQPGDNDVVQLGGLQEEDAAEADAAGAADSKSSKKRSVKKAKGKAVPKVRSGSKSKSRSADAEPVTRSTG